MTDRTDAPRLHKSSPKHLTNILFVPAIIGILSFTFTAEADPHRGIDDNLTEQAPGAEPSEAIRQIHAEHINAATEGCAKPSHAAVEAHFGDNAGTLPVAPGFDSDPGEICGNGRTYFCTSKPPGKPIPAGWVPPPLQGTNPNYQGPEPGAPFKESPYAMPTPKVILARPRIIDRGDPTFDQELQHAIERGAGKVAYVGHRDPNKRFPELGTRLSRVDGSLFLGDDDEIPAKQLLGEGFAFVLIDRTTPRVAPWIEEEMSSILIRLRDGVSLAWFHPAVYGSGYAFYRIAEPFTVPKQTKRRLTERIRTLLAGGTPADFAIPLSNDAVNDDRFRAIVSLRWRAEPGLKGRKLTKRIGGGKSILKAVDQAAWQIRQSWADIARAAENDRTTDIRHVPRDVEAAVSAMEVEVDLLYDLCMLTDRTPSDLVWYLELGLEGVSLRGKGRFHYLEPSYAVQMEKTSAVIFLEQMLRKTGLKQFLRDPKKERNRKRGQVLFETHWQHDRLYRFGRFRTVNWIEREPGGDIVELYRGVPLKTIPDVTQANLVRSLVLGAQWLMSNQASDGSYAYKYTPTNKPGRRWTPGGNIVRHALNPYTLLMVNKIRQDQRFVESAKRGIAFTLKFLRRDGHRCVICHRDPPARYYNAKIGTVAVTILSLLKLADVADISEYADLLKCLAEELLFMQDPNGHFRQYDVPPNHPYYGAESTIAPGEIIFALSRLYSHYRDERYKEALDRALPFYMTAWRRLQGDRTREGIYDEEHRVNLIGIVPWLVTAMNDLHRTTDDEHYADLAFELQDWIDNEFFWFPWRAQYPDYVGASFKTHRELPAINSCQYSEGAAAAYDLAKRVGNDEEARRRLLIYGMRYCLQIQFDSDDSTFFLPEPEQALGGYRYTLGHLRLRNDYNYHAMAAIAQAIEYLAPDDYPAQRPLRIPPVLRELLGGMPNPTENAPRSPRDEPELPPTAVSGPRAEDARSTETPTIPEEASL